MAIRSGRFEFTATAEPAAIVTGRGDATYRVLNSGTAPFQVKSRENANPIPVVTLGPGFSIDVCNKKDLLIEGAIGDRVVGIYDYLNSHHEVRSGRFELLYTGNHHTIIDLADASGNSTFHYRAFNSGDCPIEVKIGRRGQVPGQAPLVVVPVGESRDFSVSPNGNANVLSVATTTQGNLIKGVYDFLERT